MLWSVINNWMAILKTAHATEEPAVFNGWRSEAGLFIRLLTLEMPHVTPEDRENRCSTAGDLSPGLLAKAAHQKQLTGGIGRSHVCLEKPRKGAFRF